MEWNWHLERSNQVTLNVKKLESDSLRIEWSQMPSTCAYRMCHNLASSSWGGYCNEEHYKRGSKDEINHEHETKHKEKQAVEEKIFESLQRIESLLLTFLEEGKKSKNEHA